MEGLGVNVTNHWQLTAGADKRMNECVRPALLAGRKLSQKSLVPPKAFPLPQSSPKAGNAQ